MNAHFPQGELACSEAYGIGKSLSCFCTVIFISPSFFLLFPSRFHFFSLFFNFSHCLFPSLTLSLSHSSFPLSLSLSSFSLPPFSLPPSFFPSSPPLSVLTHAESVSLCIYFLLSPPPPPPFS